MSIGQLQATNWYDYIIPTGTLIDITSNPCVINSNNDLMLNPVWKFQEVQQALYNIYHFQFLVHFS